MLMSAAISGLRIVAPHGVNDRRYGYPFRQRVQNTKEFGMTEFAANANAPTPARLRFAPSPTGRLHIGGLRTALFNWLYARHTGGQFILRIEDTDLNRFDPESLDDLKTGLRWLGLEWDEGPEVGGPYGPYVQSERKELYQQYAEQLIEEGAAYRCYCSEERLAAMREEQRKKKQSIGYDRHCRYLSDAERADKEAAGLPSVVRFAMPIEGTTTFPDLLRGDVVIDNSRLQDYVLLKSDGMPTYHLAVVVDDHLMEITHVVRTEEWLPTAPLHKLIYQALDWQMPIFVHAPVILDPSGQGKMSKRKKVVGDKEYPVQVNEFIAAGYVPEAVFNFLVKVGWSHGGDQEIISRQEAIAQFDLRDISPAAAAMNYDKLDWLNGVYIREMDPAKLKGYLLPFLSRDLGIDEATLRHDPKLDQLVSLVQERINRLTEATEKIDWAFVSADEITYPDPTLLIGRKLDAAQSIQVLQNGLQLLKTVEPFDSETLEAAFRAGAEKMDVKVGSFFAPFRVAITGKKVAPPLFDSMVVLDRTELVTRVENALRALQTHAAELA
jgi:glutamyl-tRNA synthetase